MVHAFNPSTWEAEAGGSLSLRPAWSTDSWSYIIRPKKAKKRKRKKKEQMVQQLRALAVLPQDTGLIPSTYVEAHSLL